MMQTLSMFGNFNFSWPISVTAIFKAAAVSTFSPEMTAPECTIKFTYEQKWAFYELSPLMLAGGMMFGILLFNVVEGVRLRLRVRVVFAKAGDVAVGGVFTLLYYTYFTVVRQALEIYACTRGADGGYTLDAEPGIVCWRGGQHGRLVAFASASLVGYGVGVPSLFGWVLWYFKERIRADQNLWLIGKGDDMFSNENFSVRRRFAKLYQVRLVQPQLHHAITPAPCAVLYLATYTGMCVCRTINRRTIGGDWHLLLERCEIQ